MEIKRSLDIPGMGGTLVVNCSRARRQDGIYKGEIFSWNWGVRIIFRGPDGRYNPARTTLGAGNIPNLIEIIKEALSKVENLKKQSFPGTYSETLPNQTFKIVLEGEKADRGMYCQA